MKKIAFLLPVCERTPGGGSKVMFEYANYVANNGDLNAVFSHWSTKYDLTGWDKFYNAVGIESGCMNVDKGE